MLNSLKQIIITPNPPIDWAKIAKKLKCMLLLPAEVVREDVEICANVGMMLVGDRLGGDVMVLPIVEFAGLVF